ncbi:MAG: type II toxin-antitoxin system PemK/MazF family toxin [Actinomycetota bacterium]|nr:type II toxin-antitoxin system PemK/MazF family toxin [Actinomycetota bacterium]MDQ3681041.1 type II toxin-antitoxin system PemK/MazF family toxin [Actinomycetota bacterium]
MSIPRQGEIWWTESEDMRRPALVVTRSEAVGVLTAIVVAPVTRTVRSIPTEVRLGSDEGLAVECVATFDNLQRVRRAALTEKAGDLGPRRDEVCVALQALADC